MISLLNQTDLLTAGSKALQISPTKYLIFSGNNQFKLGTIQNNWQLSLSDATTSPFTVGSSGLPGIRMQWSLLEDNKVVIVYRASTTYYLVSSIITVSGDTISFSTPTVLKNSIIDTWYINNLSSTSFVVVWFLSNSCYSKICSYSGDTITAGVETRITSCTIVNGVQFLDNYIQVYYTSTYIYAEIWSFEDLTYGSKISTRQLTNNTGYMPRVRTVKLGSNYCSIYWSITSGSRNATLIMWNTTTFGSRLAVYSSQSNLSGLTDFIDVNFMHVQGTNLIVYSLHKGTNYEIRQSIWTWSDLTLTKGAETLLSDNTGNFVDGSSYGDFWCFNTLTKNRNIYYDVLDLDTDLQQNILISQNLGIISPNNYDVNQNISISNILDYTFQDPNNLGQDLSISSNLDLSFKNFNQLSNSLNVFSQLNYVYRLQTNLISSLTFKSIIRRPTTEQFWQSLDLADNIVFNNNIITDISSESDLPKELRIELETSFSSRF